MTAYYPGDIVVCKVEQGRVVSNDSSDYDQTHPFDIVCVCDNGYLILVPRDLHLRSSFVLDKRDCAEFGVPEKFAGGIVHFISNKHVVSVRAKMTGLNCSKCQEHYEYAEINRLDENGRGILICWSCRTYPQYH